MRGRVAVAHVLRPVAVKLRVHGLEPVVLGRLLASGRQHVVRPPAGHPARPADRLRAEGHGRVRLETQAVARRRLEVAGDVRVHLRDVPEAPARAAAGVGHDVEVVVHLAVERGPALHVRGINVEVVGDVVEGHRAAIDVDVLPICRRAQLVARLFAGVLGDRGVVGVEVEVGGRLGRPGGDEVAHLAEIRQVQRARLVAQVEHPDGRMVQLRQILGEPGFIVRLRTRLPHHAGVGAVSAPPSRQQARDGAHPVLRQQIQRGAVGGIHAQHEVDAAFLRVAHVRLVMHDLLEAVGADQKPRPVHPRARIHALALRRNHARAET